ncbi:MAG: hypothetical protein C6I00_00405 [Nitratiruptor sp.]|nr:hypothetical protein [Nitratiruptor sp.]NPA84303.1 response regulator transcription factor [Campylobacterota bacterium]
MARILIVEDESLVAMEIESALKLEGFLTCGIASSGEEALQLARSSAPDLVLLDIYLDGNCDGIGVCRQIKEELAIPIIFLTAYSDKKTLDAAIDCKPESYLVKPFRRLELVAAIRLALSKGGEKIPVCDGVYYDRDRFQILRDGQRIDLTKKEAKLLELCLQRRGKVVPFEDLEYALWPEGAVADGTRRALIHRLRSKLGRSCLRTIPGIGCQLA